MVGLDAHARMYRDSAENFCYLTRKFAGDALVSFAALDNTGVAASPMQIDRLRRSDIRGFARRWKTSTPMAESANEYIQKLLALPLRERLEAYRAIADPGVRRQVAEGMPGEAHAAMLAESMAENLNRHVARKRKPRAA